MSLLAEVVVEEWLNRHGYFTIRGIRVGVDEIDVLAIKPLSDGTHECRHVEAQVSVNPISYVTKVPAAIRKKTGIAPHNAKKRDLAQLRLGVDEWIKAKFDQPSKLKLKQTLCPGAWTRELVVGRIKHEAEIELLQEAGVVIHRIHDIMLEMTSKGTTVRSAGGADLFDLMMLKELRPTRQIGDGTRGGM